MLLTCTEVGRTQVAASRHSEAFCSNFPSRVSVGGGHTNVISAAIKEGLALTELHMSKTRGDPGQGRIQSIVAAAPLSPTHKRRKGKVGNAHDHAKKWQQLSIGADSNKV